MRLMFGGFSGPWSLKFGASLLLGCSNLELSRHVYEQENKSHLHRSVLRYRTGLMRCRTACLQLAQPFSPAAEMHSLLQCVAKRPQSGGSSENSRSDRLIGSRDTDSAQSGTARLFHARHHCD